MQKRQHEKLVKSKVAAQKWMWWTYNGKFLITTIQVNFGADSQLEKATQIHLKCCFKIFCHYQTTTATSGLPPLISQIFSCYLFCMGHTIFTVWLFLCRKLLSLCMQEFIEIIIIVKHHCTIISVKLTNQLARLCASSPQS